MKTKIITGLKKEVLVIEFKEGYELAGLQDGSIFYYDNQMNYEDYPLSISVDGSYALLGKPDEISEEDARELVESWESVAKDGTWIYENYLGGRIPKKKTALESFFSAIEKHLFWVNPYAERFKNDADFQVHADFLEAQEKTFDKNRTLIFVKS